MAVSSSRTQCTCERYNSPYQRAAASTLGSATETSFRAIRFTISGRFADTPMHGLSISNITSLNKRSWCGAQGLAPGKRANGSYRSISASALSASACSSARSFFSFLALTASFSMTASLREIKILQSICGTFRNLGCATLFRRGTTSKMASRIIYHGRPVVLHGNLEPAPAYSPS